VGGEFCALAESGEHGEVEQAALLQLEAGTVPDVSPAVLHTCQFGIETERVTSRIPRSQTARRQVSPSRCGEREVFVFSPLA
jgi:hypothetical protein